MTAHVDDARAKGARVLTGGRARPDLGPYFYEPTVLEGVTAAMDLRDDETFGPVVAVYRVAQRRRGGPARQRHRLRAQRLGLDPRRRRGVGAIATAIQAGTVNVNEAYAAAWGERGRPDGRHEAVRGWAGVTAPRGS